MAVNLVVAGLTDRGKVKPNNEDAFYWKTLQSSDATEEQIGLFIVADGIGGQEGGEVASRTAIEVIRSDMAALFRPRAAGETKRLSVDNKTQQLPMSESEERLRAAVKRANQVIRDYAAHRPAQLGEMGTTVTLALVQGLRVTVGNVGDSRTYLLRGGRLRPLTQDHSLVASLVASGQIRPDEIYIHPQRNLIYRSLGGKPEVAVDVFHETLEPGDALLLCSDGLWEMVRDPSMAHLITQAFQKGQSPADICRKLVSTANQNGGEDNITAVLVRVDAA